MFSFAAACIPFRCGVSLEMIFFLCVLCDLCGEYLSIAKIFEINHSIKPLQQLMIMRHRQKGGIVFLHRTE